MILNVATLSPAIVLRRFRQTPWGKQGSQWRCWADSDLRWHCPASAGRRLCLPSPVPKLPHLSRCLDLLLWSQRCPPHFSSVQLSASYYFRQPQWSVSSRVPLLEPWKHLQWKHRQRFKLFSGPLTAWVTDKSSVSLNKFVLQNVQRTQKSFIMVE